MGTATCGGSGFKERARVSGESRQQHNQASCQPPRPAVPWGPWALGPHWAGVLWRAPWLVVMS